VTLDADPNRQTSGQLRVVLADANDVFRMLLRRLLESDGRFEVILETGTGEAVLTALAAADLVLVDLALSGIDALTVTRALSDRYPHPVIVVLSPSPAPYLRSIAFQNGAQSVLTYSEDMNNDLPAKLVQLYSNSLAE
jgi:DNA-binding NarL/FixJ family response regulator